VKTLRADLSLALILLVAGPLALHGQSPEKLTPLDEALELYQDYSGKTVLRSPNLPTLSEFEKPITSSDTNGMRVVLENELQKHGIEFIPLREVFVLAVGADWKNSPAANYISTIKPPSSRSTASSTGGKATPELIPAGTIDFRGADLHQFLDLYGVLQNRTLLRSSQISSSQFRIRSQTALAKTDTIYMLEVSLALNGIASVPDGTTFMQVVPLRQVASLSLEAPQPNSEDPLLDPKTVRDFRFASPIDLVAYYAELNGRTAIPSNQVRGPAMLFKAQTRLTKPELLYALKTILALNGIAIVEQDDKTIQAAYLNSTINSKKKSH
jgi:hypothetical protein